MIVSARLREVRDAPETRAMLLRDMKVGGMGMRMEHVTWSMEHVERAFGKFQEKWKALEQKRREEWQIKQQEQRKQQGQQEQLREQEDLEKRYTRLTGQVAKVVKVTEVTTVPKVIKVVKAPMPMVSKVLPMPVVGKSVREVVAPKITKTPEAPKISATSATAAVLPLRGGKVTDVRTAPRHLGPVEEIGFLTAEDFRRLPGTGASERAGKIFAKIQLLGQESLSRKSQGLEAWRRCPLNALYGSIVRDALHSRMAPEQIIAQWIKDNKPCLTSEEFSAIMELNQKLRF